MWGGHLYCEQHCCGHGIGLIFVVSFFIRQGFHSRGGDQVRGSRGVRQRKGGQGEGLVEERGQGVRRSRRGRAPLPLQRLQVKGNSEVILATVFFFFHVLLIAISVYESPWSQYVERALGKYCGELRMEPGSFKFRGYFLLNAVAAQRRGSVPV